MSEADEIWGPTRVLKAVKKCTGCWRTENDPKDWVVYTFKYLAAQLLCPACQYKYGDDFEKLKGNGL